VKPGFETAVAAAVLALRPGQVATYGEIAEEAGHPGAARAVGNWLRHTTETVPWWRVVNAAGRMAPGSADEQRRRLEAEGVVFTLSGRVAMTRSQGETAWPSVSGS
jgi:methylated-DNA-protein-cysteine methyltransferase-like protein